MSDDFTIRDYQESDLESVQAAWEKAARLAHWFLDDAFLREEKDRIRTLYMPNAKTKVAEVSGKVVGFISLLGTEVGGLFLEPEYHGKGIGRALMDQATAHSPEVVLEVFEKNEIGQKFYYSYGFTETGRATNPDTGERVILLCYRRSD